MHIYQANGVLPKGLAQFSRARILDSYCGTAYLARGSFLPQPAEGLARMEMGQVPEDLPCAPAAHDYEDQSAAGTNARSKETRQWAKVGENVEAAEVGEHSIETPNSQFPIPNVQISQVERGEVYGEARALLARNGEHGFGLVGGQDADTTRGQAMCVFASAAGQFQDARAGREGGVQALPDDLT